jgi:hypothetical protein
VRRSNIAVLVAPFVSVLAGGQRIEGGTMPGDWLDIIVAVGFKLFFGF